MLQHQQCRRTLSIVSLDPKAPTQDTTPIQLENKCLYVEGSAASPVCQSTWSAQLVSALPGLPERLTLTTGTPIRMPAWHTWLPTYPLPPNTTSFGRLNSAASSTSANECASPCAAALECIAAAMYLHTTPVQCSRLFKSMTSGVHAVWLCRANTKFGWQGPNVVQQRGHSICWATWLALPQGWNHSEISCVPMQRKSLAATNQSSGQKAFCKATASSRQRSDHTWVKRTRTKSMLRQAMQRLLADSSWCPPRQGGVVWGFSKGLLCSLLQSLSLHLFRRTVAIVNNTLVRMTGFR